MGLALIGFIEFICLIGLCVGIIWTVICFFKKKSKRKPLIVFASSICIMLIMVAISGTLYSDEMEQQAKERAIEEQLRESESIQESLDESNTNVHSETENIEETTKITETIETTQTETPIEIETVSDITVENTIGETSVKSNNEDIIDEIFYEQILTDYSDYIGKRIKTTIIVSSCVNLKDEYYITSDMDANRNTLKVYTEAENNFEPNEYLTVIGSFEKDGYEYLLSDVEIIESGENAKNNWNNELSEYLDYFKATAEHVTYDNLMRYPDSYREKRVVVAAVIEDVEPDGILFNGKIKANMDGNELLINDGREIREPRLQAGDSVTIYGFGKGLANVKVKDGSGLFAETVYEYSIPEISIRYVE